MKKTPRSPAAEIPAVPVAATSPEPARRLRLEYIEAGSLTENPGNWRRHTPEQLHAIRELLDDPDVGWAGVCLFNERTGRLIDGHARKSVVDPKTPIPVLVGNWSEEAEKKILATLDPVGAMALGDAAAYQALVESVQADGLWVRDLLQTTMRDLDAQAAAAADPDATAADGPPSQVLAQMECQPFEHHDFLMLIFRNDQDLQMACEKLGIKRVAIQYPGGKQKIGLGRVIDGAKAIRLLEDRGTKGA